MEEKDTSVIPNGHYCYSYDSDNNLIKCPYWKIIPDRPEQENGWCDYLEKGDVEIIAEGGYYQVDKNNNVIPNSEIGFSLLFDSCKECGINIDDEEFEAS